MGVIAVFGASGFVGRATVESLRGGGHEVRALRAPRLRADRAGLASLLSSGDETGGLPGVESLPDIGSAEQGDHAATGGAAAVVADVADRLRADGCEVVVN